MIDDKVFYRVLSDAGIKSIRMIAIPVGIVLAILAKIDTFDLLSASKKSTFPLF